MANAALARIYGYSSPEELIQGLTDIGRRLYVEKGRREEFIRLMQEHDTITGFESPIYRKDGSVIWISENCRAIRDAQGRLLYYEGTVEDITQRRQAEENLRNSEALYHSLVETLPQNILRKDLAGTLHLRQPAVLQDAGPAPGGDRRQDRLRLLPARAGGEVSARRPAGDADRASLMRRSRNTSRRAAKRFTCRWSRRRFTGRTGRSSACKASSGTSPQQRLAERRSAGPTPCWPKAARNSAPRTRRWKTT